MKTMVITTLVDRKYEGYIPLFIDCVQQSWPEYDVQIYFRGRLKDEIKKLIPEGFVKENCFLDYPDNLSTTSSLRFLIPDTEFEGRPCVFFTDIDILMYRDSEQPFHEKHLAIAHDQNLCYENQSIPMPGGLKRMPGIHFVLGEWFEKTKFYRDVWLGRLMTGLDGNSWDDDEKGLHALTTAVGLKLPVTKGAENWRWHGLHLGGFRKDSRVKITSATEASFVQELLKDRQFMKMVGTCAKSTPFIGKVFAVFRDRFPSK